MIACNLHCSHILQLSKTDLCADAEVLFPGSDESKHKRACPVCVCVCVGGIRTYHLLCHQERVYPPNSGLHIGSVFHLRKDMVQDGLKKDWDKAKFIEYLPLSSGTAKHKDR